MKRCPHCYILFWEGDDAYDEHIKSHSRRKPFECSHCQKRFFKNQRRKLHESRCDLNPGRESVGEQIGRGSKISTSKFILHNEAFNGYVKDWRYHFKQDDQDTISNPLSALHTVIVVEVRKLLTEMFNDDDIDAFTWHLAFQVSFHKVTSPEEITVPPPCFTTRPLASYFSTNLEQAMENAYDILLSQIDDYQTNGSGWVLEMPILLDVKTMMTNPLDHDNHHQVEEHRDENGE